MPKRQKILRIILKNPGICLKELEKFTKMNRSTLRFHLDCLENEGWVYSVKTGRHRLFFRAGNDDVNNLALIKSNRKKSK